MEKMTQYFAFRMCAASTSTASWSPFRRGERRSPKFLRLNQDANPGRGGPRPDRERRICAHIRGIDWSLQSVPAEIENEDSAGRRRVRP